MESNSTAFLIKIKLRHSLGRPSRSDFVQSKVVKERYAMEKRKIVRRIILAVLLVCAVFLIYSIVTDPLGEHDIMLALAVTAGFIALEQDKRKER